MNKKDTSIKIMMHESPQGKYIAQYPCGEMSL